MPDDPPNDFAHATLPSTFRLATNISVLPADVKVVLSKVIVPSKWPANKAVPSARVATDLGQTSPDPPND